MKSFDSSADDLLLLGLMRVARKRYQDSNWEEIEPSLKESWEQLRAPVSAPWPEVADKLRAYCERH
jgi:hypothetical protein